MVDVPPVTVVGVADDRFELLSPEARLALDGADVVAGGRRLLSLFVAWRTEGGRDGSPETLEIAGDAAAAAAAVRREASGRGHRVCVLASGDPGFFGVVRALVRTLDRTALRVLPAPSAVSLAFARLGLPWDDATVVSAHGRPIEDALGALRAARKAAVLTSPDAPPEAIGAALLDARLEADLVAVCSRLGSPDEEVLELSVPELAAGSFDPRSVVVLVGPGGLPLVGWHEGTGAREAGKVLAWGAPEGAFDHRAGMITKSEVRAVVLAKLALPPHGVLWDVGAGSGSVAVECAALAPGLQVFAVEERAETVARISANARSLAAGVHVVPGRAPGALRDLPAPDRAFVGGGGMPVLRAVLEHLRPGGRLVAAFAAIDRAADGAALLGNVVEVAVSRGERLPDGGLRLVAQNPVFVVWGPE